MALVTLRESQVKQLSTRGQRGHAVAALTSNPNRFLSAVQIGVTLTGFLSAAFGASALEGYLSGPLVSLGVPEGLADPLSVVVITIVISYFSIVFGELTAKRLAMQRAEAFALALAPMVNVMATVFRPVIWFLGKSTDLAVRVFGGDPNASREVVTDEEIRAMVVSSATLGDEERQIVDEVFAAGQVSLRQAMIPRTEVDFLDGNLPAHRAIREVGEGTHSRYPVIGRDVDDVLGFLHVRDLFDLDPSQRNAPISQLVRPIATLPGTMKILRALSAMQQANSHLVIVSDEYGGTAGIVTIEDLVEELIGDITDEFDPVVDVAAEPASDTLVDGLLTLEQFEEETGVPLPDGPYDTVAGFLMARLGRLPGLGDAVEVDVPSADREVPERRVSLTVVELDGRRAARLRLQNVGQPVAGE
ncbi:MAG: HlyC/CorC family transporter [Micropruina sp.]|nr:MAG: HlyC/CorC family transporter [Micropruina sp.]